MPKLPGFAQKSFARDRTHATERRSYRSRSGIRVGEKRETEALVDDRDVFNRLFERHGAALSAFLRGLTRDGNGDGHEAEDIFQDVAARVWKALKTNATPRVERAWILTIAYRAFLDHRAKNPGSREFREEEHFLSSPRRDREGDPVALAELAENKRRIDSAVAELSEPLRAVVLSHYAGGLSLRDVAETLEISVGTVKSRLNAALEQLRRRLS